MKPETQKRLEKNCGYAQPRNVFLRLNRFPLKNNTFDFETTIDCVNSILTFYCCFHKYQFGKAG